MIRWKCLHIVFWVAFLLLLPLATGATSHVEDNDGTSLDDLSMDDESLGDEFSSNAGNTPPAVITANLPVKEQFEMMKRAVRVALRRPGGYAHLAQVLPILRAMTGPQRLAFASFVFQQIGAPPSNNDEPALKMVNQLTGDTGSTNEMVPKLLLPLSADIAQLFRGVAHEMAAEDRSGDAKDADEDQHHVEARSRGGSQVLPLWRGQIPERRQRPLQPPRKIHTLFSQPVVNRRHSHITDMIPPPPPKGHLPPPTLTLSSPVQPPAVSRTPKPKPLQNSCELFTDGVCLMVQHYPEELIRQSIREDPIAAQVLTTDPDAFNLVANADLPINRRKDDMEENEHDPKDTEGKTVCASKVIHARPQKARNTSGQWKYIVNTAEHSQTLRMEKCTKLDDPCSYVSDKLLSRCNQKYAYHRLLTWDKEKGLSIDIFKIVSCCSCEIFPSKHNPASIFLTSSPNEASGAFSHNGPSIALPPQFETSALHESVGSNSVHPRDPTADDRDHDDPYHYMVGPTKTSWPFRKPATLRPPNLHLDSAYELGEDATAEDLVPPSTYTPQTDLRRITVPYSREPPRVSTNRPLYHLPGGRPTRNRTRSDSNDLPDLTAEGSQRRPYPLILSPESISRPSQPQLPTTTSTPGSSAPTTQGPRRVNYSYHPIIEFFRPEQRVPVQQPRLSGRSSAIPAGGTVAVAAATWSNEDGWNPITPGPQGVTSNPLGR